VKVELGLHTTRTAMSPETKTIAGVTLIAVPSIQYGGYFLLRSLLDGSSGYMDNPLRQSFFRAGHAHAGVFVLLSLVCQMLADAANLPWALLWLVRLGIPVAAIIVPLGFFVSMASPKRIAPNPAVSLIYLGALLLAISVISLGIGLLRAA
jgi:Ni,Fe-hydrogenase I cytochrome b subunit